MNLPTNDKRQRLQIGQKREANQSATFSTKFLGTFQTKNHDLIITNIDNVIMTLMNHCSLKSPLKQQPGSENQLSTPYKTLFEYI